MTYLVPMGSTRSMGPVIHRDEQRAVTMPSMRAESKEPFGEEERALAFSLLLPHVARAFHILERLHVLQAGEDIHRRASLWRCVFSRTVALCGLLEPGGGEHFLRRPTASA